MVCRVVWVGFKKRKRGVTRRLKDDEVRKKKRRSPPSQPLRSTQLKWAKWPDNFSKGIPTSSTVKINFVSLFFHPHSSPFQDNFLLPIYPPYTQSISQRSLQWQQQQDRPACLCRPDPRTWPCLSTLSLTPQQPCSWTSSPSTLPSSHPSSNPFLNSKVIEDSDVHPKD